MPRHFRDRHDDPLNAARGITIALPVTFIMWAFIAWMMWGGLSSALSYSAKQTLARQETTLGSSFRSASSEARAR